MKDADIIKAVAELDGWEWHGDPTWCDESTKIPYWKRDDIAYEFLPKYLTSRDAIVPVIEKFLDKGWMVIQQISKQVGYNKQEHTPFKLASLCLTATPHQLCEALLRATGKWTE